MSDPTLELPYAHGGPLGSGSIKLSPDDFIVEEILGFNPSGEGEHVFLRVEKRHENTDWVAKQLARLAGISPRNVGYAGLKDRHGLTTQWFSVQLPGVQGPDWTTLNSDHLRILNSERNNRKLKKGAASGNRFELTIRDLTGCTQDLNERLLLLQKRGVPNYFGPQRFGRDGRNVDRARALFSGSLQILDAHLRGLYLSACRSEIFNRILAERVSQGNWDMGIPGDAFMFPDSRSFFKPEDLDEATIGRVSKKEIHPSGVLWGDGESAATLEARQIEQSVVSNFTDLCKGLEASRVEVSRRQLRLCPEGMNWEFPDSSTLKLSFILPSGTFATTVLRELLIMNPVDI